MSPHEAAADWLIRVRAAPGDVDLSRAFDRWLSESEENRRAFAAVDRSWRLVGEVRSDLAGDLTREAARPAVGMAQGAPGKRRSVWKYTAGAAALAALFALFLVYPSIITLIEADYRTSAGETLSLDLDDGSRVFLGASSAIAVDMTDSRRTVYLLAGEAYFVVTSDAARPFVVDAGEVDVTVLGTTFNVRMSEAQTEVALAEGSVALDAPDFPGAALRLSPGQGALLDRQTGRFTREDIALEDIGSWRDGRLFVQDATIGEVVDQLRRYHTAWIAVPDNSLAQMRVTGLYDLRNPDKALRALVEPHGGKVRAVSPYLRILSGY